MYKSNHDSQSWKCNAVLKDSLNKEKANAQNGILVFVTLNIPGTYEINRYNFLLDNNTPHIYGDHAQQQDRGSRGIHAAHGS